jgi:polysaccharide pyruvyl transferase WcaK-like protein
LTRITVTSAYGGFNIGDEATLRSIARLFADGGGDGVENVIVFHRGGAQSFVAEHEKAGLRFHDFKDIVRTLRLVAGSNLVVGGGGVIQGRGLVWFSSVSLLILTNRLAGRRPVVLGVGANRPTHWASRFLFRRFFGLASVIACRDEPSARVVEALGIPRDRIRVTADFAFALPPLAPSPRNGTAGRLRALVVPGCDRKFMAPATNQMRTIVHRLAARVGNGLELVLMPHDLRHDFDVGEIARVSEGLPASAVSIVLPRTLAEVQEVYRSVDFVVSNRLHPLILGAVHDAVPVAAAYSTSKVRALIEALRLPDLGDTATAEGRLAMLDALTPDRIAALRPEIAVRVAPLRALARSNGEIARGVWNGG